MLVDARFVREGVLANDCLVAHDHAACGTSQQAANAGQLGGVNASMQVEQVRAHFQRHDDFFHRAVARALADAVDGTFNLACAGFQRRQRVRGGEAQVIVAVRGPDDVGIVLKRGAQVGEDFEDFGRRRIADRIGYIQGAGTRIGNGLADFSQKVGFGTNSVFWRELNLVEQLGGVGHRPNSNFEHLIARLF